MPFNTKLSMYELTLQAQSGQFPMEVLLAYLLSLPGNQ